MTDTPVAKLKKKPTKKVSKKYKLSTLGYEDYLKIHFPKGEDEIKADYKLLWSFENGKNYRINFHSQKDIRSYFVQVKEDKNGNLSYKIL